MSTNLDANETYLNWCAQRMLQVYGGVVVIRIMKKGDLSAYPDGIWFDDFVGTVLDIAGVDVTGIPKLYLTQDGSSIPFDCAEIVEIILDRPFQRRR